MGTVPRKQEPREYPVIGRNQSAIPGEQSLQTELWANDCSAENPAYLSRQLITCIGNKRALLGPISGAVERVKRRLGKPRLRVFDAFSGSGAVSRFFKAHATLLVSNDLEEYAAATARCHLRNRSAVDLAVVAEAVADLNHCVEVETLSPGFIQELYSPRNENCITKNDRVFYTKRNARRLDDYRRFISQLPTDIGNMLLGPLLSQASVHANTAGVFKGFYKNRDTKIGQFGGSGGDALKRILGEIKLEIPVLSMFECEYHVLQEDANVAVNRLKGLDLAYLDPPYNQHPYGSNYFMLNLITRYERPQQISRVSGIPMDWQRSGYNVRAKSLPLLKQLLESVDAPFLLVSFNNEGFIPTQAMNEMLGELGSVEIIEIPYNAFRGSRNFNKRSIHVTEHLFLVERR